MMAFCRLEFVLRRRVSSRSCCLRSLDLRIAGSLSCLRSLACGSALSLCFGLFLRLFIAPFGQQDADPGHDQTKETRTAADEQYPVGESLDKSGDHCDLCQDTEGTGDRNDRKDQIQDPGCIIQDFDLNGSLKSQDAEDEC